MALPCSTAGISVRIPHRPSHSRAIHAGGIFLKKTTSCRIISINKRYVPRGWWRGVVRCGIISEWSEGNAMLEEEVFKFMEASEKPNHFPSKQELLSAGLSDLVARILEHGGWLAAGWDSEDSEPLHVANQDDDEDDTSGDLDGSNGDLDGSNGDLDGSNGPDERNGDGFIAQDKPSLQKVIDVSAEDVSEKPENSDSKESGIAAILNRLERERTLFYSEASEEKKRHRLQRSKESREHWTAVGGMQPLSVNGERKADDRSFRLKESQGIFHSRGRETAQAEYKNTELDLEENLVKPERWGIPSVRQMEGLESETKGESGVSDAFWERQKRTGEQISPQTKLPDENRSVVVDKIDEIIEKRQEWMWNVKTRYSLHSRQIYSSDVPHTITSRIQQLESQLASTLGSLRSGKDALEIKKDDDTSALEELEKASNAIEFRETEIMKMRAKLRSTSAKLAAMEGKMAMEIMEVRKAIEEKQKQVDEAQKVVSLLRIARIVWPNSASEVFLAGSFDGWTSQRRMGKSNAGVFVISMHLYPGRYEIKFIVDGIWRVDPQRPVVYSNGFENNLLVIN